MITESVTFPIREGLSRDEVITLYEKSVPTWKASPDLIRKSYLYASERGQGGGVYTWKTLAAAHKGHGDAFKARIRETFGGQPHFTYFQTPIVVDNQHGG